MPMDDKPLDGVREGRRGWEWGRRGLKWAAGRRLTVAGGATVLALHAHAHAHSHVYTHTHTHTHGAGCLHAVGICRPRAQ